MRNDPANLLKLFQKAERLHKEDKLDQAARLYKSILETQPNNFETLHRLGCLLFQKGRHPDAFRYIDAALKIRPNDPVALSNLGLVQATLGHPAEALTSYDKALALKPDFAEALNRRGNALWDLRRPLEALASYETAAALNTQFPEALNNCSLVLRALGRPLEALARSDSALAVRPGYVQALNNRGLALQDLKRPQDALASYDAALALDPDFSAVLNNRGNALRDLDRPDEALASYDRALTLRPDYVEALTNRGTALRDLKRLSEALADHDRALALKPDYAEAFNNRASVLTDLGRPTEALESYERALALRPDFAEASDNRGILLTEIGRFDEAVEAIEGAIRLNPRRIRSYYNLIQSKRMARGDPHIRAMEDLAADMPSLSIGEQIDLYFALGKALGDIGDDARSFQCLLSGNALKRRLTAYDERTTLGEFERLQATFTKDLMRGADGEGEPSAAPVFIVGMPRSGTTLVEQILASHPRVFAAGETDSFSKAMEGLGEDAAGTLQAPEAISRLSAEQLQTLGARYLGLLGGAAPATAERITNKTPENFRFVGLIHRALPKARFIHTQRDPIDTCLSCFSKQFTGALPYAYDLAELGRYHRAYEALMAHWRAVAPQGLILDVRYEDVVADLEGQARRIVAHCGLDWDPRCLDFHLTERSVRTASALQVRQPLYKSSVGRWRAFAPFLEPLIAELQPSTEPGIPLDV